jgi:hypothetical protein
MFTWMQFRRLPATLTLIAVAMVGLALAAATGAANSADTDTSSQSTNHRSSERLVVRGEDTVKEVGGGACPGGVCQIELADGVFRGTPVGAGAYNGSVQLRVAEAFANGEDGVCAPITGRIELGAGSPDRLVLALLGDSCQDGAGPLTEASFTNLAHFVVKYGTGAYAKARGSGVASFSEDATDRERMTLIGRISR